MIALALTEKGERDLRDYLETHEHQIFIGENDYGDLYEVFVSVIGREPVTRVRKARFGIGV